MKGGLKRGTLFAEKRRQATRHQKQREKQEKQMKQVEEVEEEGRDNADACRGSTIHS